MSLFTRNLNKCGQDITLEDRDEKIINGQSTEVFANPVPVRAIVKTIQGVSVFDDTNVERVATHRIAIAYIVGVTSSKWVKLGTKRIKILTVENCAEKNRVLILMCTERGEDSKVVNQA